VQGDEPQQVVRQLDALSGMRVKGVAGNWCGAGDPPRCLAKHLRLATMPPTEMPPKFTPCSLFRADQQRLAGLAFRTPSKRRASLSEVSADSEPEP